MSLTEAALSGIAGVAVLTTIHEVARKNLPNAPRMDLLGMNAIEKGLQHYDLPVPTKETLREEALAGDLLANGLFYGLVACGRPEKAIENGLMLGLIAGVGAVTLPGYLKLGTEECCRSPQTQLMTIGWYVAGGLVAGLAYRLMARR